MRSILAKVALIALVTLGLFNQFAEAKDGKKLVQFSADLRNIEAKLKSHISDGLNRLKNLGRGKNTTAKNTTWPLPGQPDVASFNGSRRFLLRPSLPPFKVVKNPDSELSDNPNATIGLNPEDYVRFAEAWAKRDWKDAVDKYTNGTGTRITFEQVLKGLENDGIKITRNSR